MSRDMKWRLLLPKPIRTLPADLAAVTALVLLTVAAVTVPGVRETPLRIILGLPYVLFLPGYALIAALFPEAGHSPPENPESEAADTDGIDGIERVALSFGLSIAVVPLIGLVLNFTPWGLRLVPIVIAVSGFTIIFAGVAVQRRQQLDRAERFTVPYNRWIADAKSELFRPESQADAVLNVLLVASVLLAAGSVGYAVAVPGQGERFSEFYLLTENESGELVADDYPTTFTQGETKSVYVGIGNHEGTEIQYTVVTQLQRVEVHNNSTTVLERTELGRQSPTVAANSTWQTEDAVTPTMTGDRLRLTYLLYKESPPEEPTIDNAYREVHLWVNVTESSAPS